MKTGSSGTFVISWSQTEIDGTRAAPLDHLSPGATWRWQGPAQRVDGLADLLRLEEALGAGALRERAGRKVQRLFGPALSPARPEPEAPPVQGFTLTDGHSAWSLQLAPGSEAPLLTVTGPLPPADRDLWVTEVAIDRARAARGGVICFTPGTRVATPQGARAIETLRPGDLVLTADAGPQPVIWTGQRRMTGARLYAMPHLRPIRIKAQALGAARPEPDLVVSPQHRLLLRGPQAQALFHSPEVLVKAQDLVNDATILTDARAREVTYIHLLFDHHQLIWANGVLTESFHPAEANLEDLDPQQRQALPDFGRDGARYGAPIRRNLSTPEAAILRHDLKI